MASIGIDLGTTRCCVAYLNKNNVEVIAENYETGARTIPSYILLTDEKEVKVGRIAEEEAFKYPERVAFDSKRMIGRTFDDQYLQNNMKHWPFKVRDIKNRPLVELELDGEPVCFTPQEISAKLLHYMKTIAEEYIGKPVKNAVIAVPAHFNYHQRRATTEAGEMAGLTVLGTINEPTAAALAYVHKSEIEDDTTILVFDHGGGTFDVSIVKTEKNLVNIIATAGDTQLGGRDFDNNLSKLIERKVRGEFGEDFVFTELLKRRIASAAERMKERLSERKVVEIELLNVKHGIDFFPKISREEFEDSNKDLFARTIEVVQNCLQDSKLEKSEINEVVLVGGSTRIPKIQQMLSEFFEGITLSKAINPDEAVAYGAAIRSANFDDSSKVEVKAIDLTSLSIGVDMQDDLFDVTIPRNSRIPITKTITYETVNDKQLGMLFNIYEGERKFCVNNTKLGQIHIKLPPEPPGYNVKITFHVNASGILEVNANDVSGGYSSVAINYEERDSKSVKDMVSDAAVHKPEDDELAKIAQNKIKLKNYCVRLQFICDYDKGRMEETDKNIIKDVTKAALELLQSTSDLTSLEEIKAKKCEIRLLCRPIYEKYDYNDIFVRHSTWQEFYEHFPHLIEK